jgi:urea transport system permease protein
VVWVATGGRGTLYGAVVGAFTVNYGKTLFTSYSPETWLFALGALFVIVTLVLPKGLVGLFNRTKKSESAHETLDEAHEEKFESGTEKTLAGEK